MPKKIYGTNGRILREWRLCAYFDTDAVPRKNPFRTGQGRSLIRGDHSMVKQTIIICRLKVKGRVMTPSLFLSFFLL